MLIPHVHVVVIFSLEAVRSDDAFSTMLDWLQVGIEEAGLEGQHVPLKETFELRRGQFGNMLFSKRHIDFNDTLAILPFSRLMLDHDSLALAQRIAVERKRQQAGKATPWASYIGILPDDHKHLPKNWDQEFLREHFQGSAFPQFISQQKTHQFRKYQQDQSDLTWAEFEWGLDITATRAMEVEDSRIGASLYMLYPLFDIAYHDNSPNIGSEFNSNSKTLTWRARRQILPGEQLFLRYYTETTLAWMALHTWGFTTDIASGQVVFAFSGEEASSLRQRFLGTPRDFGNGVVFIEKLSKSVQDDGAKNFLRHLRGLCHDGDISEPAMTWDIEVHALRIGHAVLETVLAKYPETLAEDEKALEEDHPDPRMRFVLMIRLSEKLVLQWWQQLFSRALERAPHESNHPVDDAYLERLLEYESEIQQYRKKLIACLRSLQHDAEEAGHRPVEFGLVIVTLLVGLEACLWAASHFIGKAPRKLPIRFMHGRSGFVVTVVVLAYAVVAASSDLRKLDHVLKYQMALAWLCAIFLYVVSQSLRILVR